MESTINTLIIKFDKPINEYEIPLLRGAVTSSLPRNAVLFHDHDGEKLRYAYPLIQYKRVDGKAALVCIGMGTKAVWDYFSHSTPHVKLGKRETDLVIDHISSDTNPLTIADNLTYAYTLQDWLPLNETNYARYKAENSLVGRVQFLEHILTGNILSMFKGLGIRVENKIEVSITSLKGPKKLHYKNIKTIGFDADFDTNIQLPDYIGLGKHVSVGFGTLIKKKLN